MSREKFFSKPVDDEKKQGQHKQEKGGGEEPAGIGEIKVQIVDGRGNQGVEGNRHGRKDDHHFERQPVFDISETKEVSQGRGQDRHEQELDDGDGDALLEIVSNPSELQGESYGGEQENGSKGYGDGDDGFEEFRPLNA